MFCYLLLVLISGAAGDSCICHSLDSWPVDWSTLDPGPCCLNISLSIETLDWNMFTPLSNLRVLHLSHCGITDITDNERGKEPTRLENLYMDNNSLKQLPDGFLSNAPNLKVLHLQYNQLMRLPSHFLQSSDLIQEVDLSFNNLTSVPPSIFKPSLLTFGFLNNSLDCTCALFDTIHSHFHGNDSNLVLEDLICTSPRDISGMKINDIKRGLICRSHRLTVILICIPLVVVLGLMCWYLCCRRRKGSYSNTQRHCNLVTVDRNGAGGFGDHPRYEPRPIHKDRREPELNPLKDPILLKPSAALLGSSRDLYEEVEIKLGTSADSLVEGEGQVSMEGPGLMLAVEEEDELELKEGEEPEVETVSVTDVMKDSTDREKMYMNQATDYYSLVPGIELEDSDHCEYESVDLS
ncbi:uncharacterized protein O3C94_016963 isoform 2-T2 [Discoglossus pictus]